MKGLDCGLLAMYAESEARFGEVSALVRKMAAANPQGGGFVIDAPIGPVRNPLLREMDLAMKECLRLAGELGVGPSARARLAVAADTAPEKRRLAAKFFS